MILDCHGHYTNAPRALSEFRAALLAANHARRVAEPAIGDGEIREGLARAQVAAMDERGIDRTILSPTASAMAHHQGDAEANDRWARACNDLVHRACELHPGRFAAACQLPQTPGVSPASCRAELERCVRELHFVGCNLNPDPSGGRWSDPPLTDPWWYPLWEAATELDVPVMIHASASCTPSLHTTGAHYLAADTAVFMQMLDSDLFADFPSLRIVLPHGAGAVPFHWGRYRGLAASLGRDVDALLDHVFFDTCVYHQAGIDLLARVLPHRNVLFGSEALGAVPDIDPQTGHAFDDTRRYVEATPHWSDAQRADVFDHNVRRVYSRLAASP